MMHRHIVVIALSFALCLAPAPGLAAQAAAQAEAKPEQKAEAKPAASIQEKTRGLEKQDGFFPFYWDAKAGKLWLEVDTARGEFLYVNSLPAGLGSNDVGLDRGQLGATRIVRFRRVGPRVLLVQPNYSFRAVSSDANERRAVRDSFAESVLWGFAVEAEEGSRVLVDATAFVLRDAHDVPGALRRTRQGAYNLDGSRTALYLERTKNFPFNTEIEATLTFTISGGEPGEFVRAVTPSPEAVTVREHHSFVRLPAEGYQPRAYDPRAGYFGLGYADYAAPLGDSLEKRFIARHRLKKKDPAAAMSEPVEPIVYYLDRGAPEPIRSALLDGARWWDQAFEAAGYKNAFRVELMPEGADPMDLRYNVIQWVHRATRGWSYGASVTDPRTGEILKGHVTLGSLRVRQDYLIAEGILAPYETGKAVSPAMREMALARLRQLAAHEVGHTLGLTHNFVASTLGRASVMDYPHPFVRLTGDGAPDLSEAYATGAGEWDKVAIAYGYQEIPAGEDEGKFLDGVLRKAQLRGLYFISDADARPPGGAHPSAHLWDNGTDAADELRRMMQVRARILSRFSENNIREGAPMATLEDTLVPMYLFHRYQTEAAAKEVGGLFYTYALRGDGQTVTRIVSPAEQRKALAALVETLDPAALTLPEKLLEILPPRPPGFGRTAESFSGRTGLTFDPQGPVEAAAELTAGLLLHPQRAARLIEYHARDAHMPGLDEVMDRVVAATWKAPRRPGLLAETQRTVDSVVLRHLFTLAANDAAAPQSRALANAQLASLKKWMETQSASEADAAQKAHLKFAAEEIARFQREPEKWKAAPALPTPPGQPIGADVLGCEE
jgi:hypothetical protein